MSEDRDVAVVGMACVFPGAADLESYWRNVVNGVDAISELPAGRWPGSRNLDLPADHLAHIPCRRGGFVSETLWFDAVRHRVMPSAVRHGDPDQFIVLELLARALAEAGLGADDPRRATTDVIVGRGGYTSNKMMDLFLRADLLDRLERLLAARLPALDPREVERLVGEMRDGLPQAATDSLVTSIPNLVASRAANRLDLGGVAYTVDAACASSLIAVEQAVRRLREGLCDVALACGINFTHVPTFWYLFARILALSPSGALRPFDRKADGLLIGEGAGAVVLKRLADARRDGDAIHAVIRGVGSASDGAAAHILAPAVAGQVRALERAYADAGVEPDSVDLLEAHGTGTVEGDLTEIASIGRFFGKCRLPHATRVMGSVKSMIGHTMPAAGIASLIKTALALEHKILPPSLHCDEPRPELAELPFYVSSRARPWLSAPSRPPRRAGINAFGFGGVNAHVVLEELREPEVTVRGFHTAGDEPRGARARSPRPALRRPTELLCFAAADPGSLAQALHRAARFVEQDRGGLTLEELAHALAREANRAEPCRLAFVASGLPALTERLAGLAARLERGEPPVEAGASDAFYSARVPAVPGRLAGLFPGLAFPGLLGNYPEHLLLASAHSPPARAVLDLIESRDAHPDDPLPTSFLLGPPEHLPAAERERLKLRFAAWTGSWLEDRPDAFDPTPIRPLRADERLLSVMGMLASNEIGWRRLLPFKLPFEMLCGQSLGEISALCAAGCFEFAPAIERLWPFLSIDPRLADLGCLAYVAASETTLAPHLARLREVEVAIHLSPAASIVGGPEPRVAALVQELRAAGIMCQKLPFPPIHTSHLLAKQREFEALDHDPLPLARPRLTVYSNLTASPLSGEPDELRRAVAGNVSQPIRFWQTLRRMYADGARVFIQVGTGSLAGNVRTVLGEDDVLSVALDVDYRDPVTQLQLVCGRLFVSGIPLALEGLFDARTVTPLALDAPRGEASPPRGAVPLCLYWPPLHVGHETPPALERPAPRAAAREAPAPLPFVGRVVEHEPGRRLVQRRRFALADDLYLADHAFAGRQHGLPLAASFPVVPLTVTLEMLAESAACLAPGRGVIGLGDVRARKWIALDGVPELEVEVRAALESDEDGVATVRAEATVDGAPVASASVQLASRYRLGLELHFETPADVAPFPVPVERLYTDHHFFHGPRFQCLAAIHARSERSISGEAIVPSYRDFLRGRPEPSLLLDPVVLDGAGQLLGALFHERGVHILPVAVERLELYRPSPPAGTRVPMRVELVDFNLDERRVSAMVEVQDGAGRVWFRIRGWQDIVFRYSKELLLADRDPLRHTLAEERTLPGLPPGAILTWLPAASLRDARPEAVARFYLSDDERPAFRALPAERRQREWLMGRIAAKDAARLWLARRRGGALLHPTQVSVESDASGRPVVRLEGERERPCISIAHKDALAVAVAADHSVGIDLEPEAGTAALQLSDFASAAEIERCPTGDDWPTRLWCGKEAAAKALGTGLGGRPRAFEAIELDPDGRLLVACGEMERRVRVRTSRANGFTFAVAAVDGQD